jgi:K+-transporting ATPase ATPase B chain
LAVALWLWFTVLFANFAEAMAEGRGKAQADTLRKARQDVTARRLRRGEADPHVLADAARVMLRSSRALVHAAHR